MTPVRRVLAGGTLTVALVVTGQSRSVSSEPPPAPGPARSAPLALEVPRPRCPPEMVDIAGRFCIDRWEISLSDARSGRQLSPYYHPSPALAERDRREWERLAPRLGPPAARAFPLPELPAWQLRPDVDYVAVSAPDRIPNAYLDLYVARRACESAGKRLCQRDEWLTACRSEHGTRHPYGPELDPARCNLAAPTHPGIVLHGRSEVGVRDPRMNLVDLRGRTLLRPTGSLAGCAGQWEDDAVYDMEGNLDEWIDDPEGTFVGGFYGRDTKWGCDERIEVHSADYYDYSLGARCCD
jgi:Sulfatase-modifying factor enzyme 1